MVRHFPQVEHVFLLLMIDSHIASTLVEAVELLEDVCKGQSFVVDIVSTAFLFLLLFSMNSI